MEMHLTIDVVDADAHLPPKGVPVLVAGGTAMLKTGGEWFSGMEEPLFHRRLEWLPRWWAAIPGDNVRPTLRFAEPETTSQGEDDPRFKLLKAMRESGG